MLVQAACYPNGTVSYSWNSDPSTWHLLVEYQCYNNGSTHEQTVSLHVLITAVLCKGAVSHAVINPSQEKPLEDTD